jgi:hypothetical protein
MRYTIGPSLEFLTELELIEDHYGTTDMFSYGARAAAIRKAVQRYVTRCTAVEKNVVAETRSTKSHRFPEHRDRRDQG